MKYTDRLIELPIIIYNDKALEQARRQEEEYSMDEAIDVAFLVGWMKLPPREIIGYYQTWTRQVSFEQAQRGTLDAVVVLTRTLGTLLVFLSLEKFEQKLNEYMAGQSIHMVDIEVEENYITPQVIPVV